MSIKDLRQDLEEIRASAQAGDLSQVVQKVEHAITVLDESRLLTSTEAAQLLGIRSVNTLKLLVRRLEIPYAMHGNRMMIPLAELERIQDHADVRGIRASDHAHEMADALSSPQGLSSEELADLAAGRPGLLPWKREDRS